MGYISINGLALVLFAYFYCLFAMISVIIQYIICFANLTLTHFYMNYFYIVCLVSRR